MLGYVLPILTKAWPGKERGGEEAQKDPQCRGLLPPIFGGAQICTNLFEFWARWIGAQTPQSEPFITCAVGHDANANRNNKGHEFPET